MGEEKKKSQSKQTDKTKKNTSANTSKNQSTSKSTQKKNTTNKSTNKTEVKKDTAKKNTTKTETKKDTTKNNTSKAEEKKKTVKKESNPIETKGETSNNKEVIEDKSKKKKKKKKDKKPNKFIQLVKKKWLIEGTTTVILVAAIVAAYIAISLVMQKIEITPIDLSKDKAYSLSKESKEKIKNQNIDKDVNVYFINIDDTDQNYNLAKQFKEANDHIKVETVKSTERVDIANKYSIQSADQQAIVMEYGDKSKEIVVSDLETYDSTTGEVMSVADEKLTSSIISLTSNKDPKVYVLSGYSDFELDSYMQTLKALLENETTKIETLNIISTGKIPDDCDTLAIMTPRKDFDDIATKAITDYIKAGKNILWFNSAVGEKVDMPNVNKILAEYGVEPFEPGFIMETDSNKMLSNMPNIITPDIQSGTATKNLYSTDKKVLFLNPTKVNILEKEKLDEKKVTSTVLLQASDKALFRKDLTNSSMTKINSDEGGPFTVGAELVKTIKDKDEEKGEAAVQSKMVIYGENYWITDMPLSNTTQYGVIIYENNRILALDSISYLVDREEEIATRKSIDQVTYTATQTQHIIVLIVIFTIPVLIIIIGIIIWIVRRRKK